MIVVGVNGEDVDDLPLEAWVGGSGQAGRAVVRAALLSVGARMTIIGSVRVTHKVVDAGQAGFSRQRMVRSRVLIRWRPLPRVVVRTTRRRTRATVRAWGCRARIVSLASASWIVRFSSRPWAFPSPVWARGSVRRAACGPCLPEGSRRARRARRSGTRRRGVPGRRPGSRRGRGHGRGWPGGSGRSAPA